MFRRDETRQPDPHAPALARAMQELRPKGTVFLWGSRAAGDYREDSDIDLFVVTTEGKGSFDTESAAREWLREHPPDRYASPWKWTERSSNASSRWRRALPARP